MLSIKSAVVSRLVFEWRVWRIGREWKHLNWDPFVGRAEVRPKCNDSMPITHAIKGAVIALAFLAYEIVEFVIVVPVWCFARAYVQFLNSERKRLEAIKNRLNSP